MLNGYGDNEKKKYGLLVLRTVPVQQNVLSVCCMDPSLGQQASPAMWRQLCYVR